MADNPYNADLPNQPWSAKCVCGQRFMQPNSYGLHIGRCLKFKDRLGKHLQHAKQARKGNTTVGAEQSQSTSADGPADVSSARVGVLRKRVMPLWMSQGDLDLDVVNPAARTVSLAAGLTRNEADEELGRGRRKKTLTYKIKAAANVEPSSTKSLPVSQYHAVIAEYEESVRAAQNTPLNVPLPDAVQNSSSAPSDAPHPRSLKTKSNDFGLYKLYSLYSNDLPHDPDSSVVPSDFREDLGGPVELGRTDETKATEISLYPFPNLSSFRLGEWFWSDDNEKSHQSFKSLLEIVGSESFNPTEVRGANWTSINSALAVSQYEDHDVAAAGQELEDGISWVTTSITINVPVSKSSEHPGSYQFTVPGFHYRPLMPVIKDRLQSATKQEHFHTLGCELRWKPGEGKEDVRVYGEMYHSAAFVEAYQNLQSTPTEPGCALSRHVVGLMFASDATMLAAFGSAKIWPLYMFFSNDSKYKRSKPSEKLFETVAYFEKLPDHFKEFVNQYTGKSALNPTLMTHCQRELFHEQWKRLLDPDFIEAYRHGIVVTCYDGRQRRFYPRIFTYSADYPEKILIASIKNLGGCPCPRCKIKMVDVPAMGKPRDRNNRVRLARSDDDDRRKRVADARAYLYEDKLSFASTVVEARLDDGSLVPSDNAFSLRLSGFGFNLFQMLVVDIMHEVELGVWKAIFIQLLRLLEATKKGTVNELGARFRNTPTFGRDTIRRFINNVSEMKQLAARDWEDLLQCAIPAFEGLLPSPHNDHAMKMLFTLAQWHAFAKLRMHTDHTLEMLDSFTTHLGDDIRAFVDKTCSKVETKELPREYQARKRREGRKRQANHNKVSTTSTAESEILAASSEITEGLPSAVASSSTPPLATEPIESPAPLRPPAPASTPSTSRPSDAMSSAPLDGNMASPVERQEPSVQNSGSPASLRRQTGAQSMPKIPQEMDEDATSTSIDPPGNKRPARKRKIDYGPPSRASKRLKDLPKDAAAHVYGSATTPAVGQSRGQRGRTRAPPSILSDAQGGGTTQQSLAPSTESPPHPSQDTPSSPQPPSNDALSGKSPIGGRKRARKAPANATVSKRQKIGQDPLVANALDEGNEGDGRRTKTLNLNTYKFHALGDVVPTIRRFGTTDSYSTQTPEHFHRYPKMHYKRTNKKGVSRQLSRIQARQARIRRLRKQLVPDASEGYNDDEGQTAPYFIGKSENSPICLPAFLQTKANDRATKDFIPSLKLHLLPRIINRLLEEEMASKDQDEQRLCILKALTESTASSATSSPQPPHEPMSVRTLDEPEIADVDRVYIHSDRIYQHNILHVNYTSYDVRRETDVVNPKTSRRDIMCLRNTDEEDGTEPSGDQDTAHRFVYGRVIGVYHVNVVYRGRGSVDVRKRRFDFLWVRWFSFCNDAPATSSLDRLKLVPIGASSATSFLDPRDVLRACHIIPRYSLGRLYAVGHEDRVQSKIAKDQEDWREYYVNRFVDRDMIMRHYWGHGVGHVYSHKDSPRTAPSAPTSSPTAPARNPHEPASAPPGVNPQPTALVCQKESDKSADTAAPARAHLGLDGGRHDTLEDLEQEELALGGQESESESEEDHRAGPEDDIRDPDSDEEYEG